MKTLSLVIPVYNAPDLARATLPHIPELAACAADCGFELTEAIFVDDGSEPPLDISRTGETPVLPVRILRQPQNRGKGAAVRRGALEAKGDWVLMSDVDLSAPLTEFARLAPQADAWMVCGSRYGRAGMPLRRRILSRLFHALVWLVGVRGIQDTQCGFKLFRMARVARRRHCRGSFRGLARRQAQLTARAARRTAHALGPAADLLKRD